MIEETRVKDYYVILGIGSNASLDEIKSAFRRLALELHPDRSGLEGGPFIEAQEAYATLSDPQLRLAYDHQLRSPAHRAVEPVSDFREVHLDWFDTYHPSFDELFERLWGNFAPVSQPKAEHLESLMLEVILRPDEARTGGKVRVDVPARVGCRTCGGLGSVGSYICWRCAGHGALTVQYPADVEYPAGIRDGYVMRLSLSRFGIQNFYLTVQFRVSGKD